MNVRAVLRGDECRIGTKETRDYYQWCLFAQVQRIRNVPFAILDFARAAAAAKRIKRRTSFQFSLFMLLQLLSRERASL